MDYNAPGCGYCGRNHTGGTEEECPAYLAFLDRKPKARNGFYNAAADTDANDWPAPEEVAKPVEPKPEQVEETDLPA